VVDFVDTNVLVYAVDPSDPVKHLRALEILGPERAANLVLSTQVLSEFYVVATRKLGADSAVVRAMVQELARLPVVGIDPPLVLAAIDGSQTWQISYWDALIIRAAEAAGASHVLSEDLGHGRSYGSITVANPFAAAVADATAADYAAGDRP
jgi:predicted nucleic acid-binding protein